MSANNDRSKQTEPKTPGRKNTHLLTLMKHEEMLQFLNKIEKTKPFLRQNYDNGSTCNTFSGENFNNNFSDCEVTVYYTNGVRITANVFEKRWAVPSQRITVTFRENGSDINEIS